MTKLGYSIWAISSFGLFVWAGASASAGDQQEKWNCDGTQLEMNFCAADRYKRADEELNRLYQEQINRLETAGSKTRLRDAQRAWISFRDKSCLYQAGMREESGSIWPMEYHGCMEYYTKQRIENIRKYLSCTQNGCPN